MLGTEIEMNDFRLKVMDKGGKSEKDFIIKAKFRGKREFTPKHAHFLIDFHGKLCYSTEVGQSLFKLITQLYLGRTPDEILSSLDPITHKWLNSAPGTPWSIFCIPVFTMAVIGSGRY